MAAHRQARSRRFIENLRVVLKKSTPPRGGAGPSRGTGAASCGDVAEKIRRSGRDLTVT
jgi:hypothetical protein